MDGIFVAYHTTSTIQGFQYISVDEMDKSLFGNSKMGEAAFGLNVSVLEKVFEAATGLFPKQVRFVSFLFFLLEPHRGLWVSSPRIA
jgi:hypothetical protein